MDAALFLFQQSLGLHILFSVPLCLPLGKLPLALLALVKRPDIREQQTRESLYLVAGNPCAVIVMFFTQNNTLLFGRWVNGRMKKRRIIGYEIRSADVGADCVHALTVPVTGVEYRQ